MDEIIVKILVELLALLASATKEIKQGRRTSESIVGEGVYYLTNE
jgi:hypothetical protein